MKLYLVNKTDRNWGLPVRFGEWKDLPGFAFTRDASGHHGFLTVPPQSIVETPDLPDATALLSHFAQFGIRPVKDYSAPPGFYWSTEPVNLNTSMETP